MLTGIHRLLCGTVVVMVCLLPLGAQDERFEPVTDEILTNPDPSDWLHWRRTLDGWGYSPLDQISRDNVHQLQPAWVYQTRSTQKFEVSPLVVDGIMYISEPPSDAAALDLGDV